MRLVINLVCRNFLVYFSIVVVACNHPDRSPLHHTTTKAGEYAEREKLALSYLESNGLLSLSDTAKWWFYNLFCDDTIPLSSKAYGKRRYLGSLDLYTLVGGWNFDSSRIDIICAFVADDTIKLSEIPTKYGIMPSGVTFDARSKKVVGVISGLGSYFTGSGVKSRFENLLQPDLLSFVRQNKDSLNGWYLEALKRHGVSKGSARMADSSKSYVHDSVPVSALVGVPASIKHVRQIEADTSGLFFRGKGVWGVLFEGRSFTYSFTANCHYFFPIQYRDNKIIMYWSEKKDCDSYRGFKDNFDPIPRPVPGKPFGEFTIGKGDTLRARYYYPEWVAKLNALNRTGKYTDDQTDSLFATVFVLVQ